MLKAYMRFTSEFTVLEYLIIHFAHHKNNMGRARKRGIGLLGSVRVPPV